MRKFFKEKNNLSKIAAIFVLLLFIFGYACEKEFLEPHLESEKEEAQAIDRAKAWYAANKPEETLLRASKGKETIKMAPEWKDAYTMKNDRYEMVETNLMSYGRILYLDKDCEKKFEETQNPYYKQSYTHLVFRTDRKTGETVGFLMTMTPNVEWLEKSKFNPFLESSYLYRDKHFGGTILYHNLDGTFANGWVYEKGKIVASISSLDADSADFELRSTSCYPMDYFVYVSVCTDLYIGTEVNGVDTYLQTGTHCVIHFLVITVDVCDDDGTGTGQYNGGGGGGGNGGGTGYNGGTSNNPCISGSSGNANNNSTIADSKIKTGMDDVLKDKAKNSGNEWATSVGRNPDGTYYVTSAKDCGINGHTTIPDLPYGIPLVTYGHSHGQYGIGVPSPGDLYGFLVSLASNPSLNSMYVYGTGPNGTPETYAINVYDRGAVAAFLTNYPQSANMMG